MAQLRGVEQPSAYLQDLVWGSFPIGSLNLAGGYNVQGSAPFHRLEAVCYGCIVVQEHGVGGEQVLGSDASDRCLEGNDELRICEEAGGDIP